MKTENKISGKIKSILPIEKGESKNGKEWIKTETKKPKFGEHVLVWCEVYGRFLASYEYIGDFGGEQYGNWQDFNGNLGILPPIYWMPLPEPPKN